MQPSVDPQGPPSRATTPGAVGDVGVGADGIADGDAAGDDTLARACGRLGMALRAFGRGEVHVAALAAPTGPATSIALSPQGLMVPQDVLRDGSLHRAVAAHALAHLRHTPPGVPAAGMKAMTLAVLSLLEDARAERLLGMEFPGLGRCLQQALFVESAEPGLDFASLALRLARAIARPAHRDGNYWVEKGRAGFERVWQAGGRRREDYTDLGRVLANDLGQMRVRLDPDQYRRPRHRDDDGWLWTHPGDAREAALAMLPPRAGGRDDAHHPADDMGIDERDMERSLGKGRRFHYPEWHYRAGLLREHWCTLEDIGPPPAPSMPPGPARRPWRLPRLPRVQELDRARRLRRQWEGEALDIDAAIEAAVARRAAIMPDARVFVAPGRQARAVSVLVLLDLSESANDRAQDGQRLLDRERQAALLLAAAAAASGHRVAVHGFHSDTRHAVRYVRLLDFGRPLDVVAAARIDAQRAAWSTRLGTALRHATGRLHEEAAARRAILVVTDGAPSDIDVHDPRHLVEDARMAVIQARQAGVRCHCLAVDGQSADDVGRMFGARGYDIVADPAALPARLARAFGRLLR
ncbi:nitric oxide reductase activation protein NorD [Achromobacter aloeverae]|uniref:VWFA domain-containing protein n=1 Tax=Achromobacter aloeverae TaxID=1750518 RepID=A0A4Q1HQ00_9BURK|nr:VWA domain-containing protein [Achromobacter aloeverae]RXN93128.1 hypothetical protein C7R54_05295 [Achromobacter aloeverae]